MTDQHPRRRQIAGQSGGKSETVVLGEIRGEGQVTLSPGKVEIGQGIVTALAQIAADELDVDIAPRADGARVDGRQAPTRASPRAAFRCSNRAAPSGMSAPRSGRSFLPQRPTGWVSATDALDIKDGTISGPGNVSDQLLGTGRRRLARSRRDAGRDGQTDRHNARSPASSVQRLDIPDKVFAPPPLHSRLPRCRTCCMAGCCGRKFRARSSTA